MSEGDELNAIDITDEPTKKLGDCIDSPVNGDCRFLTLLIFADDRREFERRYIARCLEDPGQRYPCGFCSGMHRQSLQHK